MSVPADRTVRPGVTPTTRTSAQRGRCALCELAAAAAGPAGQALVVGDARTLLPGAVPGRVVAPARHVTCLLDTTAAELDALGDTLEAAAPDTASVWLQVVRCDAAPGRHLHVRTHDAGTPSPVAEAERAARGGWWLHDARLHVTRTAHATVWVPDAPMASGEVRVAFEPGTPTRQVLADTTVAVGLEQAASGASDYTVLLHCFDRNVRPHAHLLPRRAPGREVALDTIGAVVVDTDPAQVAARLRLQLAT